MATDQTQQSGKVAPEYSCPSCGTSNRVHQVGCEFETTHINRIEKAYVGILSVMTLPQFDGISHGRLTYEVTQMLEDDSWDAVFEECLNHLKDSNVIEEDRDGSLHMVPPAERQSGKPLDEDSPESRVRDALNSIDPDIERYDWVRLQYAVMNWDDGEDGMRLFKEWSMRGEKWDDDAEKDIEYTWSQGLRDGTTLGTLVYLAMEHGWNP